jgi:hypothetical protein
MISFDLADRLHVAGLEWTPAEGDRFVLPDRDLDGRVFTISEMVVEIRRSPVGSLIAFNGTTEWALDSIEQATAIWLPRESQLREALGETMLSLARVDEGWRVTVRVGEQLLERTAAVADDAYGLALLATLEG